MTRLILMDPLALMTQCPMFKGLPREDLKSLTDQCGINRVKRGDAICHAGYPAKHVYILLMGSAKLVRAHPDGKERIVHLLLKGDMFGAPVVLQGGFYPVSAFAMEESTILEVERKIFQELFLKHPLVGQYLIAQMGERIQQAHEDRLMTFDTVEARIAAFLLELLKKTRTLYGNTTRIAVPLTRQDIADRVGSTVETVIRILSRWTEEGWVETQDRYIEITEEENLKASAGIEKL